MDVDTANAFGKLRFDRDGRLTDWHPLIDHLTDVATCFKRLCMCRSVRRALECAAGRALWDRDIARLAVLVFLHDLGKANSGFQAKRWPAGTAPREWPLPAGHGKEAMDLFNDAGLTYLAEMLPLEAMEAWGESVFPLLTASLGHHGRPIPTDQLSRNQAVWQPVTNSAGTLVYDPAAVVGHIGDQVRALYPTAFHGGGTPLPDAPAFGHLFAGLVQLTDWLGSDTDFFRFSDPGERRSETAPTLAATAIAALGLDADPWRKSPTRPIPGFEQVFSFSPYPAQSAAGDDLGSLVILESETGSGKTEAALWRFVQLFRRKEVDGLFFALPTRVAATQLYDRVRVVAGRLWPDAPPLVVRALPGYAAADGQEPQALPDFQVLWPDKPDDQEAQRRWAAESPKRFLAAPLAVGAIDQALFSALQVRHAHLRHALLARSLLVVDEVHASDAYMTALLRHLLRAHLNCGGHALLLSATLGASARDRYLALARGEAPHLIESSDFEAACRAPYPCISDGNGPRVLTSSARIKPVTWSTLDAMDDPQRIATLALEAAAGGTKVLVVRNTVPAAVELLRTLEKLCPHPDWLFSLEGVVTLHHSRFSRQDRPLLDAAVEARIGKRRPPGSLVLVGTQTLEQSLDLDADLLITDLCPMDVLLQRIGRLHRHERPASERPSSCRLARVLVLTPSGHDLTPMLTAPVHGLGRFKKGGGVYPDLRSVEATRRLIDERPGVEIPQDNRKLVESATHPERLEALAQELGEDWQRLGQEIAGDTGAEHVIANLHALEIHKPFDEQQGFPTDVDIATRLGLRDRLLLFDPAPIGPFGVPLRQLPMRHYLAPADLDPDTQPQKIEERAGAIEFALGAARYRYGRFGLEKLKGD